MNPYDHGPAERAANKDELIRALVKCLLRVAGERDRARATAVTLEQRVAILERGDD